MKITTFNPQIITKDAEPIVKLFEELGFDSAPEKMQVKITYAFKWYKLTKLESRSVTYEIGKRA